MTSKQPDLVKVPKNSLIFLAFRYIDNIQDVESKTKEGVGTVSTCSEICMRCDFGLKVKAIMP